MAFPVGGKRNQCIRKKFIPLQTFGADCTWRQDPERTVVSAILPSRTPSPAFFLTLYTCHWLQGHVPQFSQLQRASCDSLLSLLCLLLNQVDQSLLHWQKVLCPWEGHLACQIEVTLVWRWCLFSVPEWYFFFSCWAELLRALYLHSVLALPNASAYYWIF